MALEHESSSSAIISAIRNLLDLLSESKDLSQDNAALVEFRTVAANLTAQLALASRSMQDRIQKALGDNC
jgi:hypothetical protein